jgi:STE24 endopeptidase
VRPADLAARHFTREEIDRARRYHRPRYVASLTSLAISVTVLAVLAFTPAGGALTEALADPGPGAAGGTAIAVVVLLAVARLPLSAWTGFILERRWGFSTQTSGGWLRDWGKSVAVRAVMGAFIFLLLFAVIDRWEAWPLLAAPGAALVVVVLSYVAPVVLEPLFNRFEPLRDEELAAELRELSRRAGVPVDEILVADASRRTTKENAYVSGLGSTRRVVVYDTLLRRASPREVRLVVAHELGHRRARHVAMGTAVGALGAAAAVGLLWLLLRWEPALDWVDASGPTDPRLVPLLMLGAEVLGLLTLPVAAAVSRRWEREADRASFALTGDPEGFADMERNLALANLSELAPGRLVYLLLFGHPTPPERIATALEGPGG